MEATGALAFDEKKKNFSVKVKINCGTSIGKQRRKLLDSCV
jgi:hypothetical protein